jgi:hypothetical protein
MGDDDRTAAEVGEDRNWDEDDVTKTTSSEEEQSTASSS